MGFRTPLTAVNTGQPAGAGAKVYQGSDATGVYGVLEFRDGIAGDTPAQVTGRANLVPQGGGVYTAQGGSLALKAGSYNGVTGPELDLLVEEAPAGGYQATARLVGAPLITPPPRQAQALTLDAGWTAVAGASCQAMVDAAGYVCLAGLFTNNNAFTPSGQIPFTTVLPVALRPAGNRFFVVTTRNTTAVLFCSVRTDGRFYVDGTTTALAANSTFVLDQIRYHPTAT